MTREFSIAIPLPNRNPLEPVVVQDNIDKKKILKELRDIAQLVEQGVFSGCKDNGTYWELNDFNL